MRGAVFSVDPLGKLHPNYEDESPDIANKALRELMQAYGLHYDDEGGCAYTTYLHLNATEGPAMLRRLLPQGDTP